ncbi:hypothetical protein BC477_20265 [Clavibacter michiganensis subsp. michiganensis]|uniref:Uncharacterized protein n=1 Tax=Clavibacter michiganensis subsp. michiganensis TaxID=33013 RepID=A0A251XDW8_CLAMM|nr:hypothetical protein BC477_20265 [Clavibacter michiganensis subsp. michiganensis]OUE00038.1 hypothetical protein CMMCAS07_19805 [Clavibacter michiganensis subsp. michiganensis]
MIVCRNSTGPMIGIWPRIGMSMRSKRGGELRRPGSADSTCEKRKLVRPVTSTLSTTPTMTWSTRYLIAKAASTNETNMPATIADARPMSGCPVREATTADTNAPPAAGPRSRR